MERRVVITGLGIISSIGIGKEDFWNSLISGKSGISEISSFNTSHFSNHYGGEIKNFIPEEFIEQRKIKRIGRASQLAISATKLALEDADLKPTDILLEEVAISLGTTMGEPQIFETLNEVWIKKGEEFLKPILISQCPCNVISSNVAREFRLKGPNIMLPAACAAGNYAIGYGYDLIKLGRVDMALVGGVEAFSKIAFIGFNRLSAIAPEKCQPFDMNRKGTLLGEGAGILILESLKRALDRKAKIYAEILGYGLSCDAHHMTAPDVDGITRAMEKALKEAGLGVLDVDYINAHGTGTISNDKAECQAIKKVFGSRYKSIPISSIKSMLGHTMGAASAIEAVTCALILKNDIIPPTINYETPDSDCDIDCVPNVLRKQRTEIVLNNAFAFGGNNACLVIKKFI